VDGNKKTGVTMGSYLLSTFGYEVESTQQELEGLGVDVARGCSTSRISPVGSKITPNPLEHPEKGLCAA
jgi:hypothetical protein